MDQPVLVHADVHEGAEIGDVGHHAFEHHAGEQVVEGFDAFLELRGLEFRARIAAGLFQLGEDVAHRGQPEALVGEVAGRHALERLALADDVPYVGLDARDDALHHGIGLRVHRRGIERIVAVGNAQEAGGLLESLLAEARHLAQHVAGGEGAVLVAPGHDVLGQQRVQPRDARQQRRRGGVDVHAHGVHAVLDHRIQRTGQLALVDVVLVLAHADRLGIDLDQFGQRILQAAGDRDGAAQRHVQVGEFERGRFRGRVHRGAGLGDHHARQREVGKAGHHVADQLFGFARGGAVADGDELDLVARRQGRQRLDGAFAVTARLERVDRGRIDDLAGAVDDRHLAPGADAGVQPQYRLGARRRGQQQILQVGGEHADGLGFGAFAQAAEQFAFECRQQLDAPRPAAYLPQPARARRGVQGEQAVAQLEKRGDAHHAGVGRLGLEVGFQAHAQFQHALLAAAHQRQDAVRRQRAQRLVEIEPVAEVRAVGFLALDHFRIEQAGAPQMLADVGQQVGVLGMALGQDIARAVEGRLGVVDRGFRVEVLRRQRRGIAGRIGQDGVGQRLEAGFAGDLGARAALGLVGRVQVFQALLGLSRGDFLLQFGRQLALLRDGLQDRAAALFEFAQVAQAHL
ncbi:Uncharacterised protein [Bordetella pertussis]|nr:Uncharacterised protein [Bordetella pertussis]